MALVEDDEVESLELDIVADFAAEIVAMEAFEVLRVVAPSGAPNSLGQRTRPAPAAEVVLVAVHILDLHCALKAQATRLGVADDRRGRLVVGVQIARQAIAVVRVGRPVASDAA